MLFYGKMGFEWCIVSYMELRRSWPVLSVYLTFFRPCRLDAGFIRWSCRIKLSWFRLRFVEEKGALEKAFSVRFSASTCQPPSRHCSILRSDSSHDVCGSHAQSARCLIRGLEALSLISDRKLIEFLLSKRLVGCLKRKIARYVMKMLCIVSKIQQRLHQIAVTATLAWSFEIYIHFLCSITKRN
jgi:hypothetical protein